MKCPLRNCNSSGFIDCAGQSCAFADEAGNCLVRQALQCYVNAERNRVAEERALIRVVEETGRIRSI